MKKINIYLFSYSKSQKEGGLTNIRTLKVSYNRKCDNIKDSINSTTRNIVFNIAWSNAIGSCLNQAKQGI